jgi:hypothetical protein
MACIRRRYRGGCIGARFGYAWSLEMNRPPRQPRRGWSQPLGTQIIMKIFEYLLRRPIVLFSAMFYLCFCLICNVNVFVDLDHDIDKYLTMSVYLWPYPLLLCLQTWLHPDKSINFIIAYIVGFSLILFFSSWIQRIYGFNKPKRIVALSLSLFLWYVPLLLIQVILYFSISLMGYPVGE